MLKPVRMDTVVTAVSPWDPAFDPAHLVQIGDDSPEQHRAILKALQDSGKLQSDVSELPAAEVYQWVARFDPSSWQTLFRTHPGQKPTVFKIGAIPPGELTSIESDHGSGFGVNMARDWQCFKAALRDIENGPVTDSGRVPKSAVGGVQRVKPDWVESQFGGGMMRMAGIFVGRVAWFWNNLTGEDAKN